MKFVRNDLPADLQHIEIEIFSDLHIGSKRCDFRLIQERIKRVKENDNVYAIILGDVIDNATKTSVGDTYEEALTPMAQVKQATMLFADIKDKILGVVSGNHCARSYKTDGIDLLYFMCAELGIADKYDATACLLFVRFGKQIGGHNNNGTVLSSGRKICYTIYITHGSGTGGRTIGGKANGLERRGQIIDSDIILTGHTHQALSFRESSYKVDHKNSSAYIAEQVFVNASATLGYENYAENYGMKPNSVVSPVIILDGRRKNILVKV